MLFRFSRAQICLGILYGFRFETLILCCEVVGVTDCFVMGVEEGTSNGDIIECAQGVQSLKSEAVNNGFQLGIKTEVSVRSLGTTETVQTYTRRKRVKSQSENIGGSGGAWGEAAGRTVEQPLKESPNKDVDKKIYEPGHLLLNGSGNCLKKPCKNVVLEHIYQSLNDNGGGIKGCIHDVLKCYPNTDRLMRSNEHDHYYQDKHKCSLSAGGLFNGSLKEVRGHTSIIPNGCMDNSHDHTSSEVCRRSFFHVIASEGFASLCKLLSENFQGIINGNLLDFSVIDSKMKDGTYECEPMIFLKDFQQVWTKIQGVGNKIISFAEGLNEFSRLSFNQHAKDLIQSNSKDGKDEFRTGGSETLLKVDQTEDCGMYKVCSCSRCGGKADGRDCLVCDSCEEMYHVSCIEPAVNEIPPKSWYCAACTTRGIASPHENCVVCKRLNDPPSVPSEFGNASAPTDEETINELGEYSNYSLDEISQPSEQDVCKVCEDRIDGEKLKVCSHPSCAGKYYHVRCLTQKQLKSYGPHWYCPSCLCRVCLVDCDDEKIVLCDGCDHGYHIYCLKPPLESIPSGKWFCRKCKEGIKAIERAKKSYSETRKRKRQEGLQASDKGNEAMHMLVTVANKLHNEDNLGAVHFKS